MKRAFAIVIVVLLALGMIGMFFPAFLASNPAPVPIQSSASPTPTPASTPSPAGPTPTLKL